MDGCKLRSVSCPVLWCARLGRPWVPAGPRGRPGQDNHKRSLLRSAAAEGLLRQGLLSNAAGGWGLGVLGALRCQHYSLLRVRSGFAYGGGNCWPPCRRFWRLFARQGCAEAWPMAYSWPPVPRCLLASGGKGRGYSTRLGAQPGSYGFPGCVFETPPSRARSLFCLPIWCGTFLASAGVSRSGLRCLCLP